MQIVLKFAVYRHEGSFFNPHTPKVNPGHSDISILAHYLNIFIWDVILLYG